MSLHQALQSAIHLALFAAVFLSPLALTIPSPSHQHDTPSRTRTRLNTDWRFHRFLTNPDNLVYDIRPDHANLSTDSLTILKPYILPAANAFIADPANHHPVPPAGDGSAGNSTSSVPYAQPTFDDTAWDAVTLPHDWAIAGPFYVGDNVPVSGGMGRLPIQGVGWYRRTLVVPHSGGRHYFLDVDGAMSYAAVWVNGVLAGGWPYGYNSFRVDLTPFLRKDGGENVIALRVDNPVQSSRWYPGAGLYRNVWLTTVGEVHVPFLGTSVTTREVRPEEAVVDLVVAVENRGEEGKRVEVVTEVYELDAKTGREGKKVAKFEKGIASLNGAEKKTVKASVAIRNPHLWGPWTSQEPNLYVAVSRLYVDNQVVDTYSTEFGVRSVVFDGNKGLFVNGERVRIQGVNQHHDLGALGAAFNYRAAERQLEILRDLGCNAIRMSHNPPAPELLELTDRMGFLVINEIFDSWELEKTPNDFHLIFADWSEPDLRSFMRRDRNHASVIAWSVGNEVGEQHTDEAGAAVARRISATAREEDPTRPITASMNFAKPDMPFPPVFDIISLNYQGEGIRDSPAYAGLEGIKTSPMYPAFRKYPFPSRHHVSIPHHFPPPQTNLTLNPNQPHPERQETKENPNTN
jgi:beta-galactosidase